MNNVFPQFRQLAFIVALAWLLLCSAYPATMFLAACVACALHPWYHTISRFKSPSRASANYVMALTLATVVPITIVAILVIPQATKGLQILSNIGDSDVFHNPIIQSKIDLIDNFLKSKLDIEDGIHQFATSFGDVVGNTLRTILSKGIGLVGSVLNTLFITFIFVLVSFLCVRNGNGIRTFIQCLSGFSFDIIDRFTIAVRNAVQGVLLGIIFVAMLQGCLCGIGFSLSGVPQPAFWGLLSACVAPIPFVGTALVWLPAVIWLWFIKSHAVAIGLLLWCGLAVTGVDNVLRPLFLKKGIKAHFLTLVLSMLLGMSAFGPIGLFAGPVLLAVALQASQESALLST